MSHTTLIGKPAPSLSLPNYTGETFVLKPEEGSAPTVLFFYPSSGSYGCTKEACQFRDAIAEKDTFKPGKVQIIGLSRDSVERQKQFVEKEKLTYPVLSDVDGEATKAYGIGKGMMGLAAVARVTIIIDKKGIVRDTLDATMNYGAHSKFVARWLDKLEAEDAAASAPAPTATTTATEPQPEAASELSAPPKQSVL
ncbi:thioredoxin-like protein [Lyophyllum atratum]|nr:thioredoxin-like protein [Lyophyllum atratum]